MAEANSTSCAYCGDIFVTKRRSGRPQVYCSTACRERAKYKRRVGRGWKKARPSHGKRYKTPAYKKKQPVFACKTCGVLFLRLPGKGYGYCSDACHPNECTYKPTIAFCDGCGSAFITKRATDRYCNRDCAGRRKAACLACGADFYATRNSLGRYCSIACSLKQTHAARRLTRREKEDARRERNQGKACRVSIKPCICCERELVGPRPTKAWAGKFCKSCRDTLGSAIGSHAGRVDFLKARLTGRKCEVCGNMFTPWQESSVVCSLACERKTERHKRSRAAFKAKRRARKRTNGPYDNIDPIAVFERDGWSCYLCGIKTPRRLRGTHDDSAPEMDHIRPLSKRGPHSWENVACACRKCNQAKSDKDVVEICGQWVVVPESGKCRGETVRLMAASQMGRAVSN